MILALIIILLISIIMGFVAGNFLFDLALNPKTSKDLIINNDGLSEFDKEKWVKENTTEVNIQNGKLNLHGYIAKAKRKSNVWIIAAHGYTMGATSMADCAKQFVHFGYNVLMPNLRGHGGTDGKYITMGWLDRLDMLKWIDYLIKEYGDIKIVLYGISMGAATVMMTSGEKLPDNVKCVIEDCGYTSVWDEFGVELNYLFHLPKFPTLYYANLLIKIRAGYSLKKASCIKQIQKSVTPTLFIHGDQDNFVPFYMLDKLYDNANCPKEKLVIKGAGHAESKDIEPERYWKTVIKFIKNYI